MILFTTPCIDHFFQDCTETQKRLFSSNSNWQVMDWSSKSGCSLWKLSICSFGLSETVWNGLGAYVPLSQIWRIWSVISHLQCIWFSINLTLIKLSLAISLWTSAADSRFWAVDGHPPHVSPLRVITCLSQSFELFREVEHNFCQCFMHFICL